MPKYQKPLALIQAATGANLFVNVFVVGAKDKKGNVYELSMGSKWFFQMRQGDVFTTRKEAEEALSQWGKTSSKYEQSRFVQFGISEVKR